MKFLDDFEAFGDVLGGFEVGVKLVADGALAVDDEGDAGTEEAKKAAVGTIGFADFAFCVGEEDKGEVATAGELAV